MAFQQESGKTAGNALASIDTGKCYRPLNEAVAEITREANVRFKCFDRWVADGKLSEVDARDRLERIISAWHYLTDTDQARQMLLAKETAQ
jgi:hypothetical protein